MGLVIAATAFGVLVTSACTNVAGLTGYEFGDAESEGGRDGASDALAPPPGTDGGGKDGGSCAGKFTSGDQACATCAEANCCPDTIACALQTGCLQKARQGQCLSGVADAVCRNLTKCIRESKCPCN